MLHQNLCSLLLPEISEIMVSTDSPFMVSYLTSIVSNVVFLVVFEISDAEVL